MLTDSGEGVCECWSVGAKGKEIAMTALPLVGGCMCGQLRYEVSAPPIMIYNCHCTNCQKISGAAFNTSVIIPEAALTFTGGESSRVEWVSDQGTTRCGLFCGACGSRIVNGGKPSTGVFSLRAGTLDDTSWVQPVGDTFTRSAQPWVRFIEGGLRAERAATDYAPFVAAYKAQGRF
ncbi:MAG TPA: GFA family protein [Hyphomonadaceae bacterium]|nr:GFA family protein [Hyphomonadaceae bacterium]